MGQDCWAGGAASHCRHPQYRRTLVQGSAGRAERAPGKQRTSPRKACRFLRDPDRCMTIFKWFALRCCRATKHSMLDAPGSRVVGARSGGRTTGSRLTASRRRCPSRELGATCAPSLLPIPGQFRFDSCLPCMHACAATIHMGCGCQPLIDASVSRRRGVDSQAGTAADTLEPGQLAAMVIDCYSNPTTASLTNA